jgi:hypothetical protein
MTYRRGNTALTSRCSQRGQLGFFSIPRRFVPVAEHLTFGMNTNHAIEFKRATYALAADAEKQVALFPDFVCFGDELVLDWHYARDNLRQCVPEYFSPEQLCVVQKLDAAIDLYSGKPGDGLFVTAEALRGDPRWDDIREIARELACAMQWPLLDPWPSGATYVSAIQDESTRRRWWEFWKLIIAKRLG